MAGLAARSWKVLNQTTKNRLGRGRRQTAQVGRSINSAPLLLRLTWPEGPPSVGGLEAPWAEADLCQQAQRSRKEIKNTFQRVQEWAAPPAERSGTQSSVCEDLYGRMPAEGVKEQA